MTPHVTAKAPTQDQEQWNGSLGYDRAATLEVRCVKR